MKENFLWGAATASHQVEGHNHNDWSVWEKENAERLSRESDGKYPPENYISGQACDHYNRYEEDFDIAKSLGHNAHRFSVEWSRIEPEEGKFDEREIEHYRNIIKALRARGLEPFVTLWHWTLPVWLAKKGGVLADEFPERFARYADRVSDALGEHVRFWITINEPEIYVLNSYMRGLWPPEKKNLVLFYKALWSIRRAHQKAYQSMKHTNQFTFIGVSSNFSYFESGGGIVNALCAWLADKNWNFYFLNRIRKTTDFIGLNYYFHNRINYGINKNENKVVSDMGWELYPEGLYHLLLGLRQFQKPIYITENGLADAGDTHRAWFIEEHIRYMKKAMEEGADVRGYLHWSLLDNFEWDKGYWPRFGLVEIDYQTMKRKIRPSALEYKKIIEEGL